MTLLVRGEADILAEALLFHHAMGVDRFIVMAIRPTEATQAILRNCARKMDIKLLSPVGDDPVMWQAEMDRAAAEDGADWVLSSTAETFWVPREGGLDVLLAGLLPQPGALSARHYDAVVASTGGDPLGGTAHPRTSRVFEARPASEDPGPSVCLRHNPTGTGLHPGAAGDGDEDLRLLHYSCRSPEQARSSQRAPLKDAPLQFRAGLVRTREEIEIGLLSGTSLCEARVADHFEARDRQDRQVALRQALDRLKVQTRDRAEEYGARHAGLISAAPPEDRKNRPLYYNLRFAVSGPRAQLRWLENLPPDITPETLCTGFAGLRDGFSLFPQNADFRVFLQTLLPLAFAEDVARLRADCAGKRVILHTSCWPRLRASEEAVASFAPLQDGYHHVILLGESVSRGEDATPLGLSYDGTLLRVPVPDTYESLHRKLFYAYMLFDLLTEPELLVKIDDNILLDDAGRFAACLDTVVEKGAGYAGRKVGANRHETQWHGWHLGKCADPVIETRGYQYPLPRAYAAGGHGYVLGQEGLAACAYMYLAMKAFFAMPAVGLEDACVGHAVHARGIDLLDLSDWRNLLTLPGLITRELQHLMAAEEST